MSRWGWVAFGAAAVAILVGRRKKDDDGSEIRVVCGNYRGTAGPVDGIAAEPIYLDVSVAPGKKKTLPVETTRHAFAYVFAGGGVPENSFRGLPRAKCRNGAV